MATLDLTGNRLDLTVKAGDDVVLPLTTGSDLTAYTWAGQIRPDPMSDVVLGSLTFDTFTATSVTFRISHIVTRALAGTLSSYDIQVTAPAGDQHTLLSGRILTELDVTR